MVKIYLNIEPYGLKFGTILIDEKCFVNYIKKVLKLTNKINIISVIINSTNNGKIEVLLNINY